MSREYTPRPGAAWDTRVVGNERVVPDTTDRATQPALRRNRAERRAAARKQRKTQR